MNLSFTKMHGAGNDFVVIDARKKPVKNPSSLAKKLCDRHFGVGADGLILVLQSKKADYRMRIFNPDGSEPEMCGNGIRCFARYLAEKKITKKTKLTVETGAGIIKPEIAGKLVKVDMGEPRLEKSQIPMLGIPGKAVGEEIQLDHEKVIVTAVSMGNPHAIIFVEDLQGVPFYRQGPEIEKHSKFPKKTNVEFVSVAGQNEINVKVWERGAGETLACGTGACASVVASNINGKTGRKVKVNLPGGTLLVEWSEKDNHVYMTGPAETVFEGSIVV